MGDDVRIEPETLRSAAKQIAESPVALEGAVVAATGEAAGASATNPGFATSAALDSFVGEVEQAVQRVTRTLSRHGDGLTANADKYDTTEQDVKDSFTV